MLKYLVDEVGVDPVAKDLSGMSTIHAASMGHQLEVVKVGHTHTHARTHTLTHAHHMHLLIVDTRTQHKNDNNIDSLFAVVGEEDWFKGIVEKTKDGATPLHIAAGEIL